jgi:hypothetical protein
MHARIATFEGDPASIDEMLEGVREDVESDNRPPGLEQATGVMILVDRERGKTLGITFFPDEEALKKGDEALNQMSPDGPSSRLSVEFYEVPIQRMNWWAAAGAHAGAGGSGARPHRTACGYEQFKPKLNSMSLVERVITSPWPPPQPAARRRGPAA